jgi:LCP family protein required for cell wall assembly
MQHHQPPPYYHNYPHAHHQRPKSSQLRPRRCCGCLAVAVLIFGISTMLLCAGILLLYRVDPPPAVNILVLGNDARPGSAEDQIARTDSIMIVSIDPQNERISLLSVPRDLYVLSPNYGYVPVNTVVRNAEIDQAGTGVNEMILTLESTFQIEIDSYIRVSFEGFESVIDAIGGVNIDVPKHIVDNEYPTPTYGITRIEFFPGEQHMDGQTALIYARTRHADDDYQRAGRQQQVIDAVLTKMANPLNSRYMPQVWRAISSNIETDMSEGDGLKYLPAIILYGRNSSHIERLVIDRDYILPDGDVYAPNVALLNGWINEHLRH